MRHGSSFLLCSAVLWVTACGGRTLDDDTFADELLGGRGGTGPSTGARPAVGGMQPGWGGYPMYGGMQPGWGGYPTYGGMPLGGYPTYAGTAPGWGGYPMYGGTAPGYGGFTGWGGSHEEAIRLACHQLASKPCEGYIDFSSCLEDMKLADSLLMSTPCFAAYDLVLQCVALYGVDCVAGEAVPKLGWCDAVKNELDACVNGSGPTCSTWGSGGPGGLSCGVDCFSYAAECKQQGSMLSCWCTFGRPVSFTVGTPNCDLLAEAAATYCQ